MEAHKTNEDSFPELVPFESVSELEEILQWCMAQRDSYKVIHTIYSFHLKLTENNFPDLISE